MTDTTVVKDPVCGMDVKADAAAGRTEYRGEKYLFCGSHCKAKFDLDPAQYIGKSAKAAQGCCNVKSY